MATAGSVTGGGDAIRITGELRHVLTKSREATLAVKVKASSMTRRGEPIPMGGGVGGGICQVGARGM